MDRLQGNGCPLATEKLEEFRGLIFDTVLKLHRRYGGDFEELVSDAYMYFLQALQTYDANKAEFTTWLVFRIEKSFLHARRARAREFARRREALLDGLPAKAPKSFDIDALCRRLSPAGQAAARTAVAMPKAFLREAESRGGTPRNFLSALRTLLLQAGYKAKDITEGFSEVKEALCDV